METNIIESLLQMKNADKKEAHLNLANQEKTSFKELKTEDSIVRQSIIDFVLIYNPLNKKQKNETISDFCNKLIKFLYFWRKYFNSKIIFSQRKLEKPSFFKVLINLEEKIKPDKDLLSE